jgi:hypothetical protein
LPNRPAVPINYFFKRIIIQTQKGKKEWTFSVADNGIRINPKHQEQIFEVSGYTLEKNTLERAQDCNMSKNHGKASRIKQKKFHTYFQNKPIGRT